MPSGPSGCQLSLREQRGNAGRDLPAKHAHGGGASAARVGLLIEAACALEPFDTPFDGFVLAPGFVAGLQQERTVGGEGRGETEREQQRTHLENRSRSAESHSEIPWHPASRRRVALR